MIHPIITYSLVFYRSALKTRLETSHVFQNKLLRRFPKATRYVHNDVIHRDLKIRPIFEEIKKLADEVSHFHFLSEESSIELYMSIWRKNRQETKTSSSYFNTGWLFRQVL